MKHSDRLALHLADQPENNPSGERLSWRISLSIIAALALGSWALFYWIMSAGWHWAGS